MARRIGVKIENQERLLAKLRKIGVRFAGRPQVVIGYEAPYALRVHEDLQAYHPNGSAKYLERPARENASELAVIVVNGMRRGQSLQEAELSAGGYLLKLSQERVPVQTGRLRDSGFVVIQ
jgi:hypothetical protein